MALKNARGPVVGARMYVTLEPCYSYGRTPPCVDQIINSGIKRVIIGMKDPNPLTNGKSIAKLRRAGILTKVGFLESELTVMNEAFIKYTKTKMPFVVTKTAQSLDGKIATANGDSKWITSHAARTYSRGIRDEFDAILVGINTVLKDDPRLNGSKNKRRLKKIILDPSLKISLNARLFSGARLSDCIVATTRKASVQKRKAFLKKGINVFDCPARNGLIDLKWLFKKLAKEGIMSILVEGGAHVIGSVLRDQLADKMHIYIAPKILGDQEALSSVVGSKVSRIGQSIQLKKMISQKIGDDILVTGYV
jgi:diaminohydroxyphosphoribosylaminopyrimidine deaminase/5-amino-6-(5-phosphoribosylamino)uracil reductase